MSLITIHRDMSKRLAALRFGPSVSYTYNPLEYARASFEAYLERYGREGREVVLLGMNPGPWGMAQTGVPFGEVTAVRDWLRIEAPVDRPRREHPRKRVLGFACPRREVSGQRLWGWARETFDSPARFFSRFFVANYCPLMFLDAAGRNLTPDRLPAKTKAALLAICDDALRAVVATFEPRYVIGVGKFAKSRARIALDGRDVVIGGVLHPSPASPQANRGWAAQMTRQLAQLGIATG